VDTLVTEKQERDPYEDPAFDKFLINFAWVLKLRWAAVAGQVATIFAVRGVLGIALPIRPLASIIALEVLTNIFFLAWFRRQKITQGISAWASRGEFLIGSIMVFDILILTALLFVTGGPTNPFSIFYLANIALGAVVLPSRYVWVLGALSFTCLVGLLNWHEPLEVVRALEDDGSSGPARTEAAKLLLRGMVAAFGTATAIVVYFVTRVTSVLDRSESELSLALQRRAQTERMEALATLAGGAAHELSSPLSTIAVAAKELERDMEQGASRDETVGDARLIRREVERCRHILDQMSADAGARVGEELVHVTLQEILDNAVEGLSGHTAEVLVISGDGSRGELYVPRLAVEQTLRALIQNAVDATPDGSKVSLASMAEAEGVVVTIRDRGEGMEEEVLARCFDPFFTTKDSGKGMGLGLFLARAVIERLGGSLTIKSGVSEGTTATIRLPFGKKTISGQEESLRGGPGTA